MKEIKAPRIYTRCSEKHPCNRYFKCPKCKKRLQDKLKAPMHSSELTASDFNF